jgi:molybdopterin synthase catalytic subunit
MERIIAEAQTQWPIQAIAVAHRTGKLGIGEASVAIAVASAHRHAGLEALRYTIDELKQRAPIWKKETWSDGSSWIEQCGH